jgi:hypothetical protein
MQAAESVDLVLVLPCHLRVGVSFAFLLLRELDRQVSLGFASQGVKIAYHSSGQHFLVVVVFFWKERQEKQYVLGPVPEANMECL